MEARRTEKRSEGSERGGEAPQESSARQWDKCEEMGRHPLCLRSLKQRLVAGVEGSQKEQRGGWKMGLQPAAILEGPWSHPRVLSRSEASDWCFRKRSSRQGSEPRKRCGGCCSGALDK